jgi:Ala-tRNA(Pro) deacylase
MPAKKLKEFLDSNSIKYVVISHSTAYTAQEIAASSHVRGQELAKTVMVKADGKMAMAVVPASHKIDFSLLSEVARAGNVKLASEAEFRSLFPDCEAGAMPPFGNLYGIPVFVDASLAADEEIAFNAGTHTELVKLSFKDFERLVTPTVAALSAGPQ